MTLRNLDWYDNAACRDNPNGNWFPDEAVDTGRSQNVPPAVREAIRICGTCPALEPCRTHALTAREKIGVWGGLLAADRVRVTRSAQRRALRERQAQVG